MPSPLHNLDVDKIRRNLFIPPFRTDMLKVIGEMVFRCHFERLRLITVQIGKERASAINKKNTCRKITDREVSLLSCEATWRIVVAEYNKEMRQYAFLFAAFNMFEDAVRAVVLEKYRGNFGTDDWHKDDTRWPSWVKTKKFSSGTEHANLVGLRSSRAFLESLSFGELLAFIYDPNSWGSLGCDLIFTGKLDTDGVTPLPNLTRCAVFEKLKILQSRRNAVFHHKPLEREYARPVENGSFSGVCVAGRNRKYTDGNAKNTVDRINEIMRYLGYNGPSVLKGVSASEYTF